ncbi:MAG: ABC transporter permease [Thermoanaerobaculia bacterium]
MHTVIEARRGFARFELRELWQSRELLGFMTWRDVSVRYKQTVIGVLWAFIRPFLTMVVFTVVFGHLARLPSERVPYAVLVFAALLPWQFFATAFSDAAGSIVGNGHMITKIYFPRLILPLASIGVGIVDFAVSFLFLLLIMAGYRTAPSLRIVFLPLFILLCGTFTLGLSLWFAALYVKYRDVRHFIPFLTQLGLYVSPVAFSSTIVPSRWRLLYSLNPMVAVIDGFRWSILGTTSLYVPGLVASIAISFLLLGGGLLYFKQTERVFADVI